MEQKNTHGAEEKQREQAWKQKNKVISGEGQARPSNTFGGATCMNEYIIHKAIAVHHKFLEVCGDEGGDDPMNFVQTSLPNEPVEFELATLDEKMWARCYAWVDEYRTEQPIQWWELKPTKEIMSMLLDLPLSPDAYEEIFQLIEMLLIPSFMPAPAPMPAVRFSSHGDAWLSFRRKL